MDDLEVTDVCLTCEATVVFKTIYEYNYVDKYEGSPEEYTFCHCSICGTPALFYREDPEFFIQFKPDGIYEKQKVWPTKDSKGLDFSVPQQVQISRAEAVASIENHLYLAASVMIGRALEATCIDYDSSSKTIYSGLSKMKSDGVLSAEMYEWATELRLLRNQGAHANDILFQASDVEDGLDFLDAILEVIYDIRPKFERFKGRKS
ncbi:TPA: DUF4145 domain-containing protein [Vibrio parahaemolyticus]|uniref:DUF4145 domain-containing protein n=1 Tax=Vibrio parahaemolyticus TaxID=670 RepID=UPI00042623E7|nr:DUF4145 domain-containing protein [Vibrio parahaemolyticus]KIT48994.1 hypothetical protein H337_23975 [Vibrio parahaemolyticus EN9701121]EGQ7914581.1 DUF4145 domain-containing protein [Vibrio parahaemolyticus]EGQ9864247.1 DUF4145 domain-containing protein [Vibrio parahaemolyticus]EGW0146554.1 DUF4145 domain-containing protein [Vibrio parahaemolyticus]EHB9911901.1 DUF4145 domain-containing protein [Vibrio parahaemolyticus]